jgi:hypothetical protein
MYARLVEFRQHEGHTRVPRDYPADPQLSSWVRRQAYLGRNGELWQDWERRLTALGFEFDLRKIETTDAVIAQLVAFQARHGQSGLAALLTDDPRVAKWLQRQKWLAGQGKLPAECRERLEQLGVEFKAPPSSDEIWDEMISRLVAFHQQHGHTRVPLKFAADRKLGNWVGRQREMARNGNLLPARRVRLEELEFEFVRTSRPTWEESYARLAAFHAQHGHVRVPLRSGADGQLARWAIRQRSLAASGELSRRRRARLERIGFVFVPARDSHWEEMFQALLAYAREHGHSCVPFNYGRHGDRLGRWVWRLRASYRRGRLPADRIQRLEAMGFRWQPGSNPWQTNDAAVEQPGEQDGDFRMKRSPVAIWLRNQSRLRDRSELGLERGRLLEPIGC